MKLRLLASGMVTALALVACGGGAGTGTSSNSSAVIPSVSAPSKMAATATSAIQDPSFESNGFTYWKQCGTIASTISTAQHEAGSYAGLAGKTVKPELNGTSGPCQQVVVPAGGVITFWVYQGTNDTVKYVDQEADLLSSQSATAIVKQLYKVASSTSGWVQKSYDVSAYAGQTLWLYFGVKGNGYASDYVYQYVDNVAWAGGSTSTPAPTPTPSAGPTATPSSAPTATPSAQRFGNVGSGEEDDPERCPWLLLRGDALRLSDRDRFESQRNGEWFESTSGDVAVGCRRQLRLRTGTLLL